MPRLALRPLAERLTCFPSPACGRGVGGEGLCLPHSPVLKPFRAPAGARVTSLLLVHAAAGAAANSEAGLRGGGQHVRSQGEVTKRKRHPGWRVPSIHGRNVREAVPGFSSGLGQPLLRCLNSGVHAVACPREKANPSMGSPTARPDRPHLTAAQGPRKSRRASCAPEASVPPACSHAPLPSRGPLVHIGVFGVIRLMPLFCVICTPACPRPPAPGGRPNRCLHEEFPRLTLELRRWSMACICPDPGSTKR